MNALKQALKGRGRPEYTYQVEGVPVSTREAARIVQRSMRDPETGVAPRILQTKVITQVIR